MRTPVCRVLLTVAVALPVLAQTLEPFEVVVAGTSTQEACVIEPLLTPAIRWFNPDRQEMAESESGSWVVASADHQRVFLFERFRSDIAVDVITPSGGRTPFFRGVPNVRPTSIAVAPNGRVLVGYEQSTRTARFVFVAVISPAGTLEATHQLADRNDRASVGPDGCTLFYTSVFSSAINRFNVCTGTALTPFTAAVHPRDVEALPDGRVLVALEREVLLYSPAGLPERTFSLDTYGLDPGFSVLQAAVSPDGGRLYIGAGRCDDTGILLQVHLAAGTEMSRRLIGFGELESLVTGLAAPSLADVPTASEGALLLLALTLALAAVFVLKR